MHYELFALKAGCYLCGSLLSIPCRSGGEISLQKVLEGARRNSPWKNFWVSRPIQSSKREEIQSVKLLKLLPFQVVACFATWVLWTNISAEAMCSCNPCSLTSLAAKGPWRWDWVTEVGRWVTVPWDLPAMPGDSVYSWEQLQWLWELWDLPSTVPIDLLKDACSGTSMALYPFPWWVNIPPSASYLYYPGNCWSSGSAQEWPKSGPQVNICI